MLVALSAYLLGSIPFGFLVARAKGIDIRNVGSGNIGATNALRVLGKPAGILVLVLDALKGWLAVLFGQTILRIFHTDLFPLKFPVIRIMPTESAVMLARLCAVGGVCAVLGHNYTCWLKFKGGKGIATTAGVFLALAPEALFDCPGRIHSGGRVDAGICRSVPLPARWRCRPRFGFMTPHDIYSWHGHDCPRRAGDLQT